MAQHVTPADIQLIRITLMKHGEFYHPAQIRATVFDQSIEFVLNTAISQAGVDTLDQEYDCLKRLTQGAGTPFVPRVYGKGRVAIQNGRQASMFLGDWFDGYHEFHLSHDPEGEQNVCVWDETAGPFYLDTPQTYALYYETARILTSYYDPGSFHQIFPWHHAAGDFVVNVTKNNLSVRLVTVRKYGPVFTVSEGDAVHRMMTSLLLFLLDLSVRTRLDRLDGIGDIAWAEDVAVLGTWAGFLAGLSENRFWPPEIGNPKALFEAYLGGRHGVMLPELLVAILNTFHPDAPEVPVILQHIEEHVAMLCQTIDGTGFPRPGMD